jgi:hypothetical protein
VIGALVGVYFVGAIAALIAGVSLADDEPPARHWLAIGGAWLLAPLTLPLVLGIGALWLLFMFGVHVLPVARWLGQALVSQVKGAAIRFETKDEAVADIIRRAPCPIVTKVKPRSYGGDTLEGLDEEVERRLNSRRGGGGSPGNNAIDSVLRVYEEQERASAERSAQWFGGTGGAGGNGGVGATCGAAVVTFTTVDEARKAAGLPPLAVAPSAPTKAAEGAAPKDHIRVETDDPFTRWAAAHDALIKTEFRGQTE